MQQTAASLILISALASFLSQGICSDQSDRCINPAGEHGLCQPIHQCPDLIKLLQHRPIFPEDMKTLNGSRCTTPDANGRLTLVCCPTEKLPRKPRCGWGENDRLRGGQPAFLEEFPWTAVIEYRHRLNGQIELHCGATLISSRYVLTAAHCIPLSTDDWEAIGVRLSEYDLSTSVDCEIGPDDCISYVSQGIEKTIVHEGYIPHSKEQYDDIALIRLDKEIEISTIISPICLPMEESDRTRNITESRWSKSVGWGLSKSVTGFASEIKSKVGLRILDRQECSKIDGINLRDTQFCTEIRDHKYAKCTVNSGGSLMVRDQTSPHLNTLYGISSFGKSTLCGSKEQPAVFTDVTKYIKWIESNVEI